jgi:hypothetical protein
MPAKPRGAKKPAKKKLSTRSNSRVQKHRDKMRAAGLKPVQLWVWDTKDPAFIAQIKRECELINAHADSKRVDEEMLSVADFSDWKW